MCLALVVGGMIGSGIFLLPAQLWLYVGACVSALVLGIARAAAVAGFFFGLWALWGSGLEAGGLSLLLMLTAVPLYLLRSPAQQPAEQAAVA